MTGRIDLGIGARAYAILTNPVGRGAQGRREVRGVAAVRVLDAHVHGRHDVFRCIVEASADERVGRELELRRGDLYAMSERAEVREFIEAVHTYWGRDNAPVARSA